MFFINKKIAIILKTYNLSKNFNFYISFKKSLIFLKGFYGIFIFKLPSYYFFKKDEKTFYFIFLSNFFFSSFLRHFFVLYNRLFNVYSVRLRVKGLGFRIRKISKNLYYFFFNYTNMFYMHIPKNILIR